MQVILLKILKANPCSLTKNRKALKNLYKQKSPLKKEEIPTFDFISCIMSDLSDSDTL